MPRSRHPEPQLSVKLTQAQRKAVAEIAPELADRLKLDERNQRAIPLTLAELRTVKEKARSALRQAGTGRGRIPLRYVFQACGQALDQHLGTAALPDEGLREWFLAEFRAIASRYQWQYVAPNRQPQVAQIAYRLWQEEGCPHGRHEDHWRQAEQAFHADKPIRGAILDDPKKGPVGQLLSPLQASSTPRAAWSTPLRPLSSWPRPACPSPQARPGPSTQPPMRRRRAIAPPSGRALSRRSAWSGSQGRLPWSFRCGSKEGGHE
jgi:hypothetical protein